MTTSLESGIGIGVETTRSYLAEDVPSGSRQTVIRHLKALVDRDDVQRVWLTPIGSKIAVWEHIGPLTEVPDLDHLFTESAPAAAAA